MMSWPAPSDATKDLQAQRSLVALHLGWTGNGAE